MRKVVYGMAVSLDGFMEGPNGETDWMSYNPGDSNEYIKPFDTFLLGRKSYEIMMKMGASANAFPGIASYVFSKSLAKVAEGFNLISTDAVPEVRRMKNAPGKDIALCGGALLASSLINAGLVDEIVLSIQSILLGSGKPMFQNLDKRIKTKLVKMKTNPGGVVLHYQVGDQA